MRVIGDPEVRLREDPVRMLRAVRFAAKLGFKIETGFGRDRAGGKGGPRTLDLDLLLYGERVMRLPRLVIPRPRLHQRAFVLYPLAEIAADLVIPGRGAVRELLPGCAAQDIRRLDEALT